MTDGPFLEAHGIHLSFGSRVVLREVALSAGRGEIMALFGPNGAGKTTLLRILATALRPTRGRAVLDGRDLLQGRTRLAARRRIGLLSHQSMLYDRLTAMENLLFYARMYGVVSPQERSRRLIAEVGLAGREEDLVRDYSRGMQQRLSLARSLVHDPDLLLLDEPFTGLDPEASAWLGRLLSNLAGRGKTLIFTSHDLESGLAFCRRATILVRGALAFDAPREGLSAADLTAAYRMAVAAAAGGN